MERPTPFSSGVDADAPLTRFRGCHAGMLRTLAQAAELPALAEAAARARALARSLLDWGEGVMPLHHEEEERELFPAVLRSCGHPAERAAMQALVDRLTAEHRALEQAFRALRPALRALAAGNAAKLDAAALKALLADYEAHARFEEREFLPPAQIILGRDGNQMAGLGLALHLRHAPPVVPYV